MAKEYAERNSKSHNCLIPENVRFKAFKNVADAQLHEADRPCPQSDVLRDDVDDIFDSFFPSDKEEFMRKEPSGKWHRYQKWSGYQSSSSDDSVVFVSEKTVPEYTGTSFTESNTTLRLAFTAPETIPFENKSQNHVEKLQRIRDSKRAYKQRIREEARQALSDERRASESWLPERAVDMKPVEGLEMEAR